MGEPQGHEEENFVEQDASQDESCTLFLEPQHSSRPAVFQSVSGLFSGIFAEASIVKVDPLRCISIKQLRSRPICRWGVKKIKKSVLGQCSSESFVNGFVSTGKFSVIAEIPVEQKELVIGYFKERGETQEEARVLAASGKWFHIVEGCHVHRALVECIDEFSEKFAGFRWPVVEISWQPAQRLRAIGRMCNEMQKDDHIIDFPLPDAMHNLREIIDSHSKNTGVAIVLGQRAKPGFIKEVVEIYAGRQGYSCNTLRTVCGVVLKLSTSFIGSMRSLLTEECDDLWRSLGPKRPFGDDTRIFKKLISTQSLKRTPSFVNQKTTMDQDRVNVIHRLRFLAKERESFKAFSSAEIESQSQSALAARREIEKFGAFLGDEEWPSDMENLKGNMLQTTLLDSVVMEHTGGQEDLLPAIVSAYLKATGAHGSQKLGQYQRMRDLENGQEDEVVGFSANRRSSRATDSTVNISRRISDSDAANLVNDDGNEEGEASASRTGENEETDGQAKEDPDALLREGGVELRVETLLEYERGSVGIDESFDFVIADPFQKVGTDPFEEKRSNGSNWKSSVLDELIDEKGVSLYLRSIRRLLRRGGHFFVFLEWSQIQLWKKCCTESHFEVVCEPFLVIKDPERVQKMTLKGLQTIYEPALVLRKPGVHPDGFEVDRTSPYTHLPACKLPRWCNVIDGIPPAAQKVTFKPSRAQVRPNEKPCSLYIELLMTFCPPTGTVLDPFSATLTMGLACMATGRRCVLLETDEKCLSYSKPRAADFAKSRLIEKDIETHQNANQCGTENEFSSERMDGPENKGVEEFCEIEHRNIENTGSAGKAGSAAETSNSESESNTAIEATRTSSDSRSSELSTANRERQTFRGLSSSQLSSIQSPSISQTCKQLSFVTSGNTNAAQSRGCERAHNASSSPAVSEVSTPIAKKRLRKNRSPLSSRRQPVEVGTPSACRRSKRSRKATIQYRL